MIPGLDLVPAALGALAAALLGALFAAGDTAFTSITHTRLAALIEQSKGWHRGAYERIQRDEQQVRSRYLLGRLFCTAATAGFFLLGFESITPRYALYAALVGTVVLTGALFEISTTLSRKHADRVAPAVARYLRPLEIAMLPFAVPLSLIGALIARSSAAEEPDPKITETEVELLVVEGQRTGLIAAEPAEMIRNMLEFSDRTARDIMIPREKVEAIDVSTPVDEARARVREVGHSRYPVFQEELDNVVGLLYAKDLFKIDAQPEAKSLRDLVRTTVNFAAGTQPLSSLLKEMRKRREHLAVVVDELGAVAGIVTLEDILEEIVGDIRDEHDEVEEGDAEDGASSGAADSGPTRDAEKGAKAVARAS